MSKSTTQSTSRAHDAGPELQAAGFIVVPYTRRAEKAFIVKGVGRSKTSAVAWASRFRADRAR